MSVLTLLAQGEITVPQPSTVKITDVGRLISGLIGVAMLLAALAVFIYLIWGGFEWITSGGDKAGVENARNKITAALIGLVIVASAWAIMRLVEFFFGITVISGTVSIPKPY
ncbi:hypothetical protein HY345_00670 [Candidatus Microgenomates bacterium]|nr:hypothetical protein [Candidatus Microgenomates bacterium]